MNRFSLFRSAIFALLLTFFVPQLVLAGPEADGPKDGPLPTVDYGEMAQAPGVTWGIIKFLRTKNQYMAENFDPQLGTRHRRSVIILNDLFKALAQSPEGAAKLINDFGIIEGNTTEVNGKVIVPRQDLPQFQKSLDSYLAKNWVLGNFHHLHKKRFFIAEVEKNAVAEMEVIVEYYPGDENSPKKERAAAHTEARFVLKEGKSIRLFAEVPDQEKLDKGQLAKPIPPERQIFLGEAIYSVEAVGTPGNLPGNYSRVKGQFGLFGLANRLTSSAKKFEAMYGKQRIAKRYLINGLTEAEVNRVFMSAIQTAHVNGSSKTYNTVWRSCTESIFVIIEEARPYTQNVTLESWFTPEGTKNNIKAIGHWYGDKIYHYTQMLPDQVERGLILRGFVQGPRDLWYRGHVMELVVADPVLYKKVIKAVEKAKKKSAPKCVGATAG